MKKGKNLYGCIKKALVPVLAMTLMLTSSLFTFGGISAGSVAYAAEDTVTVAASLQPLDSLTTDKVELTVSISGNTAEALSGIQMRIIYPEEFDIVKTEDCDFFGNGTSFFGEDGAHPMYCSFGSHGADGQQSESTDRKSGDLVKFTFEANRILDTGKAYTFGIEDKDAEENITLEAFVLTTDEDGYPWTNYLYVVDASNPATLSYTPTIPGGTVGEGEKANTITTPVISNESGVNKYVIKQQNVSEALKAAGNVVIDTKKATPDTEPNAELVISKKTVEEISGSEKSLILDTDAGQLTFNKAALQNIGNKEAGDNLVIYVSKKDTVEIKTENKAAVDFEVTAALVDSNGDNPVSVTEFGGEEVEVALDLPESLQGETVECWNYTDRVYKQVEGEVRGSQFVFSTSHFSKYIVAELETLEAFAEKNGLTDGVTVSGTVKGYNSSNAPIVSLYDTADTGHTTPIATAVVDAAVASGGQYTWNFSFAGVPDDTYDLVVTKAGHLTYTITGVKVEGSDIDLTSAAFDGKAYQMITLLAGDMNGDGKINNTDLLVVRKNLGKSNENILDIIADITGDNKVNNTDLLRLRANLGRTAKNNSTMIF